MYSTSFINQKFHFDGHLEVLHFLELRIIGIFNIFFGIASLRDPVEIELLRMYSTIILDVRVL